MITVAKAPEIEILTLGTVEDFKICVVLFKIDLNVKVTSEQKGNLKIEKYVISWRKITSRFIFQSRQTIFMKLPSSSFTKFVTLTFLASAIEIFLAQFAC